LGSVWDFNTGAALVPLNASVDVARKYLAVLIVSLTESLAQVSSVRRAYALLLCGNHLLTPRSE